MKLLPYDSSTFTCGITIDQLKQNLDKNVKKVPSFSFFSINHSKPFQGSYDNNKFKIIPNTNYWNSFLPVFYGRISTHSDGIVINLKIIPHYFAFIFLIVSILFRLLLQIITQDNLVIVSFNIPIPILAAVISFILIYIGFCYEATNSIIKFKNNIE